MKIKDNIYGVGVFNPNMRISDIVVRTEFGTSYNAFAIIGKDRTVLIDTAHERFADEYIGNLGQALGAHHPDALILQHSEPDHSGTVERLLKLYPDIEVITSQAGSIYIKKITNNPTINLHIAGDGESYDLGGGEQLRFLSAPFLHWPDSMFTYYAAQKTVFTCDFLGCHYCELGIFDKNIKYRKYYDAAFINYYSAIFSPFKKHVLAGLDQLAPLDFDLICPSHGPLLTGASIAPACVKYREWSAPEQSGDKSVCIFYCSAYGYTRMLAEQIAAGIGASYKTELYDLTETPMEQCAARINECGAFLVGSPTLNRDAVPPIWSLLSSIDGINSRNKPCAAFGSYGWSGEAVPNIEARLNGLKCKIFGQNLKVQFRPSEAELAAAGKFGQDFAAWLGETLK